MILRLLCPAVLCMTVLCTVAVGDTHDASRWDGTVTLCQGTATLTRNGEVYGVVRGAGIRLGDKIQTSGGATVAMLLEQGPAITIGPQAAVSVNHSDAQWIVKVTAGETRLVHDGETSVRVIAGSSLFWVDRAIVQLSNQSGQSRFELVAGSMIWQTDGHAPRRITKPSSFVVHQDGSADRVDRIGWKLDHDEIRLVAAMQTSPALPLPPVVTPRTTPDVTARSDALGQTDPFGLDDGSLDSPPDDTTTPPLDEDDDLLAQDAVPPVTRGGLDDEGADDTITGAISNTFGGSSSLSLGSLSSATGSFFSGGIFGDANQQTFQGKVVGGDGTFPAGSPFPGGINLVTTENQLPFDNVLLTPTEFQDLFGSSMTKFYSIGTGDLPTGQILTNFFTGTGPQPTVVDVAQFDAHVVFLDQYNIPDPAEGALDSNIGLTGLIGPAPTGPTVIGTTPLVDDRAELNQGATFALGEFMVTTNGPNGVTFAIRRSDQDRLIVKDPGGNDANDLVTPNTEVEFEDTVDPRFLPQSPTVKTPVPNNSLANTGIKYGQLDSLRQAAFTTLVADQLQDYARRTGQTRFVVDGKIVDISGFRPSP